jgi:PAS domain S-box-containing protein
MLAEPVATEVKSRLYSWSTLVFALLAIQAALSLTLKQGPALVGYCEISYLLLLLFASSVAIRNAVQSKQTIRLFWSFLASAFAVWALVPFSWFYNVVLHGKIPAFLFDNPPLFLHIVLIIAAVVSRPHLQLRSHRPYRATLNFLILLFVWVFAYAYLLFPYQYGSQGSAMILRFESLYFAENLLLLGILASLIFRSQLPWKSIYWHLFGASALYAVGSLAANVVWALKDPSGDLTGTSFPAARGLIGMVFTASIAWFVWIGLHGRRLAPNLAKTVQVDTTNTRYSSVVAMLAVLAIPIVGVWELFRTGEPFRTHEIRLLLVMVASVLLAIAVFVQDYLANREFASDVGLANARLHLAMESGKLVVWEWDVKSGRNFWFGDLRSIFGIPSSEYVGQLEDLRHYVHPDDRDHVAKAAADAMQTGKPHAGEFRVMWPDGTIRYLAATGKAYYFPDGQPERMLGVAVDITVRKRAEEALRESEERFRLVANTAPVLIWMSTPDKNCSYFNKPWLDFTGRPLESELGSGWAQGVHIEDLQKCLATYDQAFDCRHPFKMEYRLRRHDGEYRWVVDIGVPRFNADESFAGYIGSCIDVTDRKLAAEALAGVSRKLIDAQEKERARIARELHDDINQRLALLAIELQQLAQNPPPTVGEVGTYIHQLSTQVFEIGNDVQAISHSLHSSKLEYLGIVAAAKSLCKEFSEQQGVVVDFRHEGIPRTVSSDISLCLFRVLQEALHNAVKHSGVEHFEVEMHGESNVITLTVSDSGVGFDSETSGHSPGLGLISMRERVGLMDGAISITSKPSRGTVISVRIPLRGDGASPLVGEFEISADLAS